MKLAGTDACAIVGMPSPTTWSRLRPQECLRLNDRLAVRFARVIANVDGTLEDLPVSMARPRYAVARAAVAEADEIVAVGNASPVGVARLLRWIADARILAPRAALHVVANRAPKDSFRRGELVDELGGSFGVASVTVVPFDRRVEAAAWNGQVVGRGPFMRAVDRVARELAIHDHGRNAEDTLDVDVRAAS
jgi:hypothetical protein